MRWRSEPGVEVVGSAADGRAALEKIDQLKPDVITLDLEMPDVDGLEVLRQLQTAAQSAGVIVISALTDAGAAMTTQALRLGAFDFVLKPNGAEPRRESGPAASGPAAQDRTCSPSGRHIDARHAERAPAKCDLALPHDATRDTFRRGRRKSSPSAFRRADPRRCTKCCRSCRPTCRCRW